jgi:hypothetical protein
MHGAHRQPQRVFDLAPIRLIIGYKKTFDFDK